MSDLQVTIDGHVYDVSLDLPSSNGSGYDVIVNGKRVRVLLPETALVQGEMEWLLVDERPYEVVIDPKLQWIKAFSGIHRLAIRDLDAIETRARGGNGRIKSPIPGLITRVNVVEGDSVKAGQPILVLEAMKMENEIQATSEGVVTAVHVQPGQTVIQNELLVEIG